MEVGPLIGEHTFRHLEIQLLTSSSIDINLQIITFSLRYEGCFAPNIASQGNNPRRFGFSGNQSLPRESHTILNSLFSLLFSSL